MCLIHVLTVFPHPLTAAGTNLFIAGAVARGVSVLLMYPLDTLKTRLQVIISLVYIVIQSLSCCVKFFFTLTG